MKYNRMTRRHFLTGVGKSALALPFLPSLMNEAEAQSLPNAKCMVIYWSGHGGIATQNMYPIETNPLIANQLSSQVMYSSQGHNVRYGNLVNLKSTRSSNLAYAGSILGGDIPDSVRVPVTVDSYSVDPMGADFDNGQARLTPIIGSFVSDAHLAKMNLIAGLDLIFDGSHCHAQTGNFCNYSGNSLSAAGQTIAGMPNVWVPTIDAVIAKHSQFYGSSSPICKSVVINGNWGSADSYNSFLSCDQSSTGIVGNPNTPTSVGAAFNLLFSSLKASSASSVVDKKNFILNNVYEDYSRVAKGAFGPGRRIGKEDRYRLEEFMSNLNSIIKGVISGSGASCIVPSVSSVDKRGIVDGSYGMTTSTASFPEIYGLYNQIITAAFACGVSKIFLVCVPLLKDQFIPEGSVGATFSDGANGISNTDSHQGMYHHHALPSRQSRMVESMRYFFRHSFYDLMQRLDATSATGGSLLDQSLMFWTHECGFNTHSSMNLPMITAGGAGGSIKTGKYVDFRHPNRLIYQYQQKKAYQGIPYNRFLATAMQSMGLSPSDYELKASLFAGSLGRIPTTASGTVPGYGHPFQTAFALNNSHASKTYVYDYMLDDMSVPLPIVA